MNDTDFKDRVKQTLEQDVPDVLNQIKASPQFRVPTKETLWNKLLGYSNKRVLGALSVFVITLFIVFGIRQSNTPIVASTITLDVNPSIVITLDEDDNVIAVTGINDDGEEVIQRNIRYRGLSIDAFLDILVERLDELGYIVTTDEETNVILIEVDSNTTSIRDRVEGKFKEKLDTKLEEKGAPHWVLNAREILLNDEHKDDLPNSAMENMYSRAKLILVYRILELDDTYDKDTLLRATVRQLYNLYIRLEDPKNLPNYDQMPKRDPHNPYNGSMDNLSGLTSYETSNDVFFLSKKAQKCAF